MTWKEGITLFYLFIFLKNHEGLFSTGSVFQILKVYLCILFSAPPFVNRSGPTFPRFIRKNQTLLWVEHNLYIFICDPLNAVFYFKKVILGGRFSREGACIYLWLIHVDIWQKPTQCYKAVILQLNINIIFFKKN